MSNRQRIFPTKKLFPQDNDRKETIIGRNSPLPGRDFADFLELVICSAYLHALSAHLAGGSSQSGPADLDLQTL